MRLLLSLILLVVSLPLSARPLLVATVEPLSLLARQLYGESVEVQTLLLPQQNPHQLAFTPAQARLVAQADLLVWLGPEAEPALRDLVARRQGQALVLADLPGAVLVHGDHHHEEEGHEEEGHHDEGDDHQDRHEEPGQGNANLDPHLWLAPENARRLARALLDWRDNGAGGEAFEAALDAAEAQLAERLAPVKQMPWLSQHDPWVYFHEYFGLRRPLVISDGLQGGASARRFAELQGAISTQQLTCAVAEPESSEALVKRLCRDQCRIWRLDPLARDRQYAGYTDFLLSVGTGIASCLGNP